MGCRGRGSQLPAALECSVVPPDVERPSGARFPPHPFSSSLPDVNSRSARVLFLLVVPGHLVFLYTISCMQGGHTTLTLIFIVFYMTAALLQVPMGRGPGAGLPCRGGRGGPGLAHQSDTLPRDWTADKHWTGGSDAQAVVPAESRTRCVTLAQW